jgi:hypothetical protein
MFRHAHGAAEPYNPPNAAQSSRVAPLILNVRLRMNSLIQDPRFAAGLETAGICVTVEVLVILMLAIVLNGSFLAAVVVSVGVLGPLSFWLAPPVYRRLRRFEI